MLIRGVRDFVGLLIYASFFTGFRKHPVPRGWGWGGGGQVGGSPLYGLYGDVPLEGVYFLSSLS